MSIMGAWFLVQMQIHTNSTIIRFLSIYVTCISCIHNFLQVNDGSYMWCGEVVGTISCGNTNKSVATNILRFETC